MRGKLLALALAWLGGIFVPTPVASAQSQPRQPLDLAEIASAGNGEGIQRRIQENWQGLCAAHGKEELTLALKPLARSLMDPPLLSSGHTPLRARSKNGEGRDIGRFTNTQVMVPDLLISFWNGECVEKDRSLLETFAQNVRYKLGPTLYRHVQLLQPAEVYFNYWSDWANKQVGVESGSKAKTIDELEKHLSALAIKGEIDPRQPVPLRQIISQSDLEAELYSLLTSPIDKTDIYYQARKELLADFMEGPEKFLETAEKIRAGRTRVKMPESAEFDWVQLALIDSTIRFREKNHYGHAAAGKRFVEMALSPAVQQVRHAAGYEVDKKKEASEAIDVIHEMVLAGQGFAYAQAYCVMSEQLYASDTEDRRLTQFELLEWLKQNDQPYDARAYERLDDSLGFLDTLGAKYRAWTDSVELERADLGYLGADISQCYGRMGMTAGN